MLPLPCYRQARCRPLSRHYFTSHPVAFGFWASSPPDSLSPESANKKTDQSLSAFQTDIGAAAHTTFDTGYPISNTRSALVELPL